MQSHVFKTYDIRGKATDFKDDEVLRLEKHRGRILNLEFYFKKLTKPAKMANFPLQPYFALALQQYPFCNLCAP